MSGYALRIALTNGSRFVADGDEFEVERSGMAHFGAELAPCCVGAAIGELDEVESVLDIGLQFVYRHMCFGIMVLELARESDAEYGERFGTDFFGEKEVFVESETARLIVVGVEAVLEGVVPAVFIDGTVLYGTYGVFPLIAGVEVGSFDNTSAGETEYAGFDVGQFLSEVYAQTVFMTVECFCWEKRYVLEVDGCGVGFCEENAEFTFFAALVGL